MIRELNIRCLDVEKASLRLIVLLAWNQLPITRLDFISDCKKEKIGKTAFYSSLEPLKSLGLLEEKQDNVDGRRVITTFLTDKGYLIASKIIEIENMLNEN